MRKYIVLLTIVVIMTAFSLRSSASEIADEYLKQFDEIVPEGLVTGDLSSSSYLGFDAMIGEAVSAVSGFCGRAGALFLILIGGLALGAFSRGIEGKLSAVAEVGCAVLTLASVMGPVVSVMREVQSSLSLMVKFMGGFIPIATGISYASGSVSSAAREAMGMNLLLSFLGWLCEPFFISLSGFGLCVGVIAALGEGDLGSFAGGVKKFFGWVIGITCALIMGMMSLQSLVASATDSARMRAAKYAAGSLIPVVGNTVSGALGTLVGGLSYAKSMVGAGGVFIMTGLVITPLIMLLLYRTAISASLALSDYLGVSTVSRAYSSLVHGFDVFIAVYAVAAILCIFEISLFAVWGVAEL